MKLSLVLFLLISILFKQTESFGRTQSVAIAGKLTCNGENAGGGIRVNLMESDNNDGTGDLVDSNDFLDSVLTDSEGFYNISGSTEEVTTIEPYIDIFHKCDDSLKPCQRVLRINIPKSYTTWGSAPKSTYNAGIFELSGLVVGERRSCQYRHRRNETI